MKNCRDNGDVCKAADYRGGAVENKMTIALCDELQSQPDQKARNKASEHWDVIDSQLSTVARKHQTLTPHRLWGFGGDRLLMTSTTLGMEESPDDRRSVLKFPNRQTQLYVSLWPTTTRHFLPVSCRWHQLTFSRVGLSQNAHAGPLLSIKTKPPVDSSPAEACGASMDLLPPFRPPTRPGTGAQRTRERYLQRSDPWTWTTPQTYCLHFWGAKSRDEPSLEVRKDKKS